MSDNKCKCYICENGIEKASKWEREQMEKHGWYAHMVEDPEYPLNVNIHTHGLDHTYGHMDLQIVFPLPQQTAIRLFHDAVDLIKKGVVLEEEFLYAKIIKDYKVQFIKAKENDRDVMRMIVPDKYGNLESFNMQEPFNLQLSDIS